MVGPLHALVDQKLGPEDLKVFRDRLQIPLGDNELDADLPPYVGLNRLRSWTTCTSAAVNSAATSRAERFPPRRCRCRPTRRTTSWHAAQGWQPVATTMAFVRLLKSLMADAEIGHWFVPIISDEARTFGLDAFFPTSNT